MLSTFIWKNLPQSKKNGVLERPKTVNNENRLVKVQSIINRVRERGDSACKELTKEFDGVELSDFRVSENEFKNAIKNIGHSRRQAIEKAYEQIDAFHAPQILKNIKIKTAKGTICESQTRAIQRVGLYIPGGTAPLISTVLMLGVPSKIANCPTRILCSPAQKNGEIDPCLLVAAELCGLKQIYKLGGAQAIAAMAYGTESIPKVDKIFGPGNSWVTQAKILVSQESGTSYDLPAGPSEALIIADSSANPVVVAADVLSQAEHGSDSHVILICMDFALSKKIKWAIQQQIKTLSRRDVIEKALKNTYLIIVDNIQEAIEISNQYAPEHLMLQVKFAKKYISLIQNAGSVFLGDWSPITAGDYASGTNHVLPTHGYAKSLSGLSVRDFMKTISIQKITRSGLKNLANTIKELTDIEGLDAHQRTIEVRLGGYNGK